jgi:hypothetical protein
MYSIQLRLYQSIFPPMIKYLLETISTLVTVQEIVTLPILFKDYDFTVK